MTSPAEKLDVKLDGELDSRALLDVPEPPLPGPRALVERPAVRFAATFAANVLRAGISFLTGIVVARSLGAGSYGDLNFLLGSFVAVTQILDAGSTSAFYTLLSSRRRSWSFLLTYLVWTFGVQFGGTILVVGLVLPDALIGRLWIGHDRATVLLAFAAAFMVSQTWTTVVQLGEAARKTVLLQAASLIQASLHLALILLAVKVHWLTVRTVLSLLAIEYLVLALVVAPRMIAPNVGGEAQPLREVVREFVTFCRPILLFSIVTFFYQFADRWLLQRYGGSVQQGFFAIGQQFAAISLIAATSLVNVFWKEVAEANARGDAERVRRIYGAVRRMLYFVAAATSCALMPYSAEILHWTVGDAYTGGALALGLMFFYPIHQALGHIQGTFYLAVGDTYRYTLVGLLMMIVSIPVAYLMVAPRSAAIPGLGLGAVGIAAKMVVLQVLAIAVQMQFLKRSHALKTDYRYQAGLVLALLGLSFALHEIAARVAPRSLPAAIVAGVIYATIVAAIVWRRPWLAGTSEGQVEAFATGLRRFAGRTL